MENQKIFINHFTTARYMCYTEFNVGLPEAACFCFMGDTERVQNPDSDTFIITCRFGNLNTVMKNSLQ